MTNRQNLRAGVDKERGKSELNTKRLARTALAVIVTVGIVVAIIVGCGPKWGNGTATGKTGSQSTATAHTAATVDVQLPHTTWTIWCSSAISQS